LVLELELQSAPGRLAELLRTRRWEADQAGMTIPWTVCRQPTSWRGQARPVKPSRTRTVRSVAPCCATPNVMSRTLKVASEEILSEQLGSDYSLENDPAASRTHAYWRRASPHLSSEGHTRIYRGACAGSGPGSAPSTRGRAGPPAARCSRP
jgi:hypothetical protein